VVVATNIPHVYVGPLPVADLSAAELMSQILARHRQGAGSRIATANADFLALARCDSQLARDLENSTFVLADGTPIVWLARAAGGKNVERVTGADLGPMLIREFAARLDRPVRVAIYGSEPHVAAAARERFEAEATGAVVDPVICPPFGSQDPGEVLADVDRIASAHPDLVLVALGCPRQERFIAEHFESAPGATWIGIGGSLDFYAGRRRRAPQLAQRLGLEWTVRLAQEPRRLWRRYFVRDLPALAAVVPRCVSSGIRLRFGGQ
jgi:N-acetylglucosaminyldiphosphoundecaprenol N-acetyl-beta-D-mannosaminyltransferase